MRTLPPYMTTGGPNTPQVVTNAEKRALRALYARQRKVIEGLIVAQLPNVKAKFAHVSGDIGIEWESSLKSSSAINYLRVTLGELLNASTPYDGEFLVRTAAMSAALMLSSLPPEIQDAALMAVQQQMADLLGELQANGRGLHGTWE